MGDEREIDRLGRPFIEHHDSTPAAGPWRTDDLPKDGRWILAQWVNDDSPPEVVRYDYNRCRWCNLYGWISSYDPDRWAELNLAP